jgi:NADH-quinone oxidoreductase subunit G
VAETRDNVVVRLKPRGNEAVNGFFMCDHGRLDYRRLNRPDRIEAPMAGGRAVDWSVALAAAANALKGKRAHVVANPSLSNEALFLLKKVIAKTGGAGHFRVAMGNEAPLPGVNDLALRAERAANATGAELLGFSRSNDVLAGLGAGDVLVIADDELDGVNTAALAKASAVIVIGTVLPAGLSNAAAVLPIANVVEEEGTLTNLRGRVQRFLQAKAAPALARPSWYVLTDLVGAMGEKADFYTAGAVFDALAASEAAFAGLSYDKLALKGAPVTQSMAGARA